MWTTAFGRHLSADVLPSPDVALGHWAKLTFILVLRTMLKTNLKVLEFFNLPGPHKKLPLPKEGQRSCLHLNAKGEGNFWYRGVRRRSLNCGLRVKYLPTPAAVEAARNRRRRAGRETGMGSQSHRGVEVRKDAVKHYQDGLRAVSSNLTMLTHQIGQVHLQSQAVLQQLKSVW